jgi:hypothetical protein
LDCARCAGFKAGEIKATSANLLELLGNYARLAGLRAETEPSFKSYSDFEQILTYFSHAECGGCRSEDAKCQVNCAVRDCSRERGVDFCFHCDQYPCDEGLRSYIGERWQQFNDRMKAAGVENLYLEQIKKPRY